ncbi:MAG: nucleoside 2-deoxyribosyltransferase [Pseudomonadota bacterium]
MPYKVYFAARYSRREELNRYRIELQEAGIEVTSHWLTADPPVPVSRLTAAHWRVLAETDRQDIVRADALIAFTESPAGGNGGRHVELGIAIGLGKTIIILGEPEHLFHHLEQVFVVPDWNTALLRLRNLAGENNSLVG